MSPSSVPKPPIGWPLLPVPDSVGRLSYPSLEQSVRDSIIVLLSTRPGEQLMHPDFGAGLTNFLGQSNTLQTHTRICTAIRQTLSKYEERIILDDVNTQTVPDQPSHLRVLISYRIRRTGTTQQIGFRLALGA